MAQPRASYRTGTGIRRGVALLYTLGGQAAQTVLQIVFFVILARLLSPSDFGLIAAALVVVNVATLAATTGLRTSLIQAPELSGRQVETALGMQLCLGLLVFGSVAALAPQISEAFRIDGLAPVLRVMAGAYFIRSLSLGDALLMRELRLGTLALIETVTYFLGYGGVGLALAVSGWGAWAIVGGTLAQALLRTGALYAVAGHSIRPRMSVRELRPTMSVGIGATFSQLADLVAWEGDNFVVGRFLGVSALGFYERAYRLMIVPAGLFGIALWQVLFPSVSSMRTETEALRHMFRLSSTLLAVVTLPISAFLIVCGSKVVPVVLGAHWLPMVRTFEVLSVAMFFRATYFVTDSLILGTGRAWAHLRRRAIFGVTVVLAAVLGQRWGLVGVATSVVLALFLNFVLMLRLTMEILQLPARELVSYYLSPFAVAAAVALTSAAVVHGLEAHLDALPLLALAVLAGLAAWAITTAALVRAAPRSSLAAVVRSAGELLASWRDRCLPEVDGPVAREVRQEVMT